MCVCTIHFLYCYLCMILALHVTIFLLTSVKLVSNVSLFVTLLLHGQSSKKILQNRVGTIFTSIYDTPPLQSSILRKTPIKNVGRDNIVSIVTCYGLDGPGIKFRWRQDFPHLSRPTLGPTQPYNGYWVSFLGGVKRTEHGINHLPPSRAKVQERM
jgi:hypothetical protein